MPKYQSQEEMTGNNGEKDGQVTLHYPMLSRMNYTAWAIKMKVFMQAQGVWDAVEPRTANTAVEVKKDKMALAAIYQSIPEDLLLGLAEKKSSKEAWEALKTQFMGEERVRTARIQTLKAEFESLNMKESEGVDEFAVKVSNIVSTMRALGDMVEESYVVKKLLRAVPSKFLQIASTLEQFGDLDKMTVEEVIGRLKAHEERMKGHGDSDDRKLLLTHQEWSERNKKKEEGDSRSKSNRGGFGGSRGRGRGRGRDGGGRGGRGRGRSHYQKDGGRGSSSNQDKSKIQCYNCQQFGHYAGECPNPRKERSYENNLIQHEDNEPALLLSTFNGEVFLNEENVKPEIRSPGEKKEKSSLWYLDCGASNHMTGDRSKFKTFDKSIHGQVKFGNDFKVKIEGKGSIVFQCKNGELRKLDDVYYIPDLCSNIISLGQLAEGGDQIMIKDPFMSVYEASGRLLMKVKRSPNRLYKIELEEAENMCLTVKVKDPTWLWHMRMGHINFNSLKFMVDKEMIKGVPRLSIPQSPCEGCLAGKQSRNPFPAQANFRAKKRLELIHGDLCGPVSPPTPSGNRYFMLLVDDYSRVMWVYLLKSKDEAFQAFKNFRSLVEVETGEKVKTLRTDRGGEFLSNQFTNYCKETGLERHYTSPYSPQQNGVVERKNRTVLEMVRCNLKTMRMPDALWGEAVSHSVYVLNRAHTKALKDVTPYEMWTGRKPNVDHLRVFGCIAHMKIVKGHLKKLEERSMKLVHLGVEKGSKAYRLVDPNTGKMYVSRDVVFEEQERWDWNESSKIKQIPGMSFTVDGFDFDIAYEEEDDEPRTPVGDDESNLEGDGGHDSNQHVNSPLGSTSGPRTIPITPLVTPESPISPISPTHLGDSPISTSSSIGGGAPKRFRLLSELYDETEEIETDEELLMIRNDDEPTTYREASKRRVWIEAMNAEIASIERNKTWKLVDLPKNRKAIGLKWVYKVKRDPEGRVIKHKARIVAKGYVQKYGVDYEEVFAPVARIETVRLILALAGSYGWQVHHLDVKSAFLNGDLEEEVYVTQPEGFQRKGEENRVFKLAKALYGLKQAPRAWNSCLDQYLRSLGFVRCDHEYSVYTKKEKDEDLIIGVYVDDLIVTGSREDLIQAFKKDMKVKFEMSDLGLLSYYLGIEVNQSKDGISLKQEAYARSLLRKTRMLECNPTKSPMEHKLKLTRDGDGKLINPTEYRSLVGGLRYLTHTRPDIAFAVGLVSRFMERPTEQHLQAVKGILRYVKGTMDHGLQYTKWEEGITITGYTDSDLANDINDRKSTGGMAYYVNGNLVAWASQKQRVVALSSCEAEFIAATMAACQGIWLRRLLSEITKQQVPTIALFVDNQSALELMKNPVFHGRSKHIDIRYHFIRECVENGEITVHHVCSKEQKADILTKALAKTKHEEMRILVGVKKV